MFKTLIVVLLALVFQASHAQDVTTIDVPDSTYSHGIQTSPVTHLALDKISIQFGHETYSGGYSPVRALELAIMNIAFSDGQYYPSPVLPNLKNPVLKFEGVVLGPNSTGSDSLRKARFDSLMALPVFSQMVELAIYKMRDDGLIAANHPFFSLASAFSDSTDIPFLGQ